MTASLPARVTEQTNLAPDLLRGELPILAEVKLAAPRQRAGMVLRPRIVNALDAGRDAAVTLVAAPAGYGKTTAVRAWSATSDAALAWVTLDRGDNDPFRLWKYIATAVNRIRDGLGRRALQRLGLSGMPIETVLGRRDSAAVLAQLEQSNMFVVRLERREWFRVHSLFAQFAVARLVSVGPGAAAEIHRRAAGWLRSRGLVAEATEHAAATGDHDVVAELLSEYHLPMGHPKLVVASTAATVVGRLTVERRRLVALASRAKAQRPARFGVYADAVLGIVRAACLDDGVSDAVVAGRRAVDLAQAGADEVLVAALACLAHALYFAGDLDEAWEAASRAIEHPDAARRAPGYALARSTLAMIAADQGRLAAARVQAEHARAIVGKITSSRSWIGANAAVAIGAVLNGEGDLAGAEREFGSAERFFADDVATVHHARLLVRLAELAVLQLLATDLSARQIGAELFLSPNTVRSHTRAIYRKLGVRSRADAVARASARGLLGQTPSPK